MSIIVLVHNAVAEENSKVVNTEAIPHVVIPANYPRKALLKGQSGSVIFKMDINKDGSPFNIRIIGSEPEGVFDKSALNAIKKWKFKPAIKNGQAIKQYDTQYTMVFKLER